MKTRLELIEEFNAAPIDTLFNQRTVSSVLDCSCALLERKRWLGEGIPFLKIGAKNVRYRKKSVLSYLESCKSYKSTSKRTVDSRSTDRLFEEGEKNDK